MHPKTIKAISKALHQAASATTSPISTTQLPFRIHDGISYCLPPEFASLYSEQVRKILSHANYSKKFSETHLAKKMDYIFSELLKNKNIDVESEIKNLLTECDQFQNISTVYLSLEGVKAHYCLRLGSVWIIPVDSNFADYLKNKSTSAIRKAKSDSQFQQHMITEITGGIESEFTSECAIRYSVIAEPTRALERAREEARFSIDLLRFLSKITLDLRHDVRIGLRGDRPTVRRSGFIFTNSSLKFTNDIVGSVFRLDLDDNTIRHGEESGLFALAERYFKDTMSSLDNILMRSIHWLSVALTQDEPENALITLITALECLFKTTLGSSITSTVCESTAFLLSDSKSGRLKISKTIRDFYSKRSAIAHGGKKVITESERALLLQYVITTIITVINHKEITSQHELMEWIEEQKFGGKQD